MTEVMPFLQKYDITFLRPPPIGAGVLLISSFLFTYGGRFGKVIRNSEQVLQFRGVYGKNFDRCFS